jgi:DNA primase
MVNELLVDLADRVLGKGKRTSKGNQSYHCPFCHHRKLKLEINFTENKKGDNPWHCWVCDKRGRKLRTLFKQIDASPEHMGELKKLVKSGSWVKEETYHISQVELPKEYLPILNNDNLLARHALSYLKRRNLTEEDILKYNIGYCEYGPYENMLIIPSYDSSGKLNYFTSRSFKKDSFIKYKNPDVSRDIVPFENMINWELPVILCEGPFDAMAIKRNVIPLLGKNIQPSLMKKLVLSKVNKIYIALDQDAIKQALNFCEKLLNQGKEVYLVELQGKDPSEMGFESFTKLIQKVTPLNQFKLMEKKISLI